MLVPETASSSIPSSSRLQSVSASDILRELTGDGHTTAVISSGNQVLDSLLQGGLERGKTTELWGPVGAGKSAIALTAAVKATSQQKTVIWAACASSLSSHRLKAVLPQGSLKHFYSTSPPTLTHLLTFIQHSVDHEIFVAGDLLVIDDLNTLVDFDYPRQHAYATSSDTEARKWQAGRRSVILASIILALNKIANMHRLAVIVTNGCATTMRSEPGLGPVMVPAVGGSEWDAGLWHRMAVFKDFNGQFIALQKVRGSNMANRAHGSQVLRFELSNLGLLVEDKSAPTSSTLLTQTMLSSGLPKKRTFEEIADSEDEDEYGWEDFEESDVLGSQSLPTD